MNFDTFTLTILIAVNLYTWGLMIKLMMSQALSNYLPENDDLPLNLVWEKPYNVPVDTSINDEIFQANAEIQKHVSKILTDEA